jgi:hypothetical protein
MDVRINCCKQSTRLMATFSTSRAEAEGLLGEDYIK